MSRCLVFVMTISFLGCATLTPQTAAIMTPHELCLKYVGKINTMRGLPTLS